MRFVTGKAAAGALLLAAPLAFYAQGRAELGGSGGAGRTAGRGTPRGSVVVSEEGQPAKTLASLGNYSELAGWVKINDWNQYEVMAKGNTLTHI
jgi:hypothetical protein